MLRRGAAASVDRGHGLDGPAPVLLLQGFDEGFREVGEAVHRQAVDLVHLLVIVVVEEDVAGLDGLARQVVGHVDGVAVQVALVRDGEGIFAVFALGLGLAARALQGVGLVVQLGEPERERVAEVEGFHGVGHRGVPDLALAFEDAYLNLLKIAHPQGGDALGDFQGDLLGGQCLQDVVGVAGAFREDLLVAAELLAIGDQCLAVEGQLAVGLGGGIFLPAEEAVPVGEHLVAGQDGDGLPGVCVRKGAHLLQPVFRAVALPAGEAEFNQGVEGIAPGVAGLDGLVDGFALLAPEEAPEGVFVVVRDPGQQEFGEDVARDVAVPPVEFRVVGLLQLRFVLRDVAQELAGV